MRNGRGGRPSTVRPADRIKGDIALRPLRYSINVTPDGCCHHEAGMVPDDESMRYWTAQLERADALLFGRVTYEMMESAWRQPATGTWPDWMDEWEISSSSSPTRTTTTEVWPANAATRLGSARSSSTLPRTLLGRRTVGTMWERSPGPGN